MLGPTAASVQMKQSRRFRLDAAGSVPGMCGHVQGTPPASGRGHESHGCSSRPMYCWIEMQTGQR